jgi:glycosyltransferase involved in cell wall biosynthesis
MRALWVFHFPVYGGPHNTAVGVRDPLADLGWETLAALTDESGNAEERLTEGSLETVTMPLHRLRASWHPRDNLRTAAALREEVRALEQLIRARGCDVVVVTGLMNPHGAIAARRVGVPVVWQVLDTRTPPVPRSAAMTLVRRWADSVMFNGRAVENLHVGPRPLSAPSFQFTGGVDLKLFRPDPSLRMETRRRFGVPEDALFVGTIANLNPMKGIEYFIRAASRVFEENPDSWFLINGSTYETHRAYTAALHREADASAIPRERFIWTDGLPQDHYVALDVTLVTSRPRSEGTTTTAPESLACEVPVVATDVGSVREVVRDGVTGLVVPADSPEALARETLRLAADPALRRRLGEAGRREVAERHSMEATASVCDQAFRAAMEKPSTIRAGIGPVRQTDGGPAR